VGAQLTVSEIFKSIQGETSRAGLPCCFVRLAGCNLHCNWCDTEYARGGEGSAMSVESVLERLDRLGGRLTCITGGEPMLQADAVVRLAEELLARGKTVLIETNGSLDLAPLPPEVTVVMDVKCPGSGEEDTTLPANLQKLGPGDEVKFVIVDRTDFDWAVAFLRQNYLLDGPEILFAPVHERLKPRTLAGWILESGLDVRLQVQLHRLLWPDRERGV
jgi:7-carboxy-7-deazaguanine synthase